MRSKISNWVCAAIAIVGLSSFSACTAPPPEGASDAAFLRTLVEQTIVPDHEAFAQAAEREVNAVSALCENPGSVQLATARKEFAALVRAWGQIEIYRFGPAREDSLHARIFFWPDRRGRGLKQIQSLIATEDAAATDAGALRQKSVAVQGLPALEYVLYGAGAGALAKRTAPYRCEYAKALARTIADHAALLHRKWAEPGGFAQTLTRAGADNPVYRSNKEAIQEILRATAESLEVLRDLKLAAVLGEKPSATRARLAPLYRSDLTLVSLRSNVATIDKLAASDDFKPLLAQADRHLLDALSFELTQADDIFASLAEEQADWETLLTSEEGQRRLRFALLPLGGALKIIREDLPAALGLELGFNSLDGD